MRFSIVTPSFRNSDWLRLCIASVADQPVELEHIIQDAGSDDGTLDWLTTDKRVRAFVEKDSGMYDGINRGLRRASGDILAYLNCDEQFLSGTLAHVEEFFSKNPDVEVLFCDTVVIDSGFNYRCSRQVQLPQRYHTWVCHLATQTCSTFFRRSVINQHRLFFDEKFRYVGDSEWVLRALNLNLKMAVLRCFTSAFTETGSNISLHKAFKTERDAFNATAPSWVRALRRWFVLQHRLRRLAGGMYFQKPIKYSMFTFQSPTRRVEYNITKPTFRWRSPVE